MISSPFPLKYNSLLISSPCNVFTYHARTLFQHECACLFFMLLDSVVDNEEQCGTMWILASVSWLPDFRTCFLTRCRWWNGINSFLFPPNLSEALWSFRLSCSDLLHMTQHSPAIRNTKIFPDAVRFSLVLLLNVHSCPSLFVKDKRVGFLTEANYLLYLNCDEL